jgi:hypothetical protein
MKTDLMKLKILGGPLDGKELDHDSPGWEDLFAVKINMDFYLVKKVTANEALLHYYEKQELPPGKTARFLYLTQRTKPLKIGGLMRCCAQTIDSHDDTRDEEGATVKCWHCDSSMILKNGVWEWNR